VAPNPQAQLHVASAQYESLVPAADPIEDLPPDREARAGDGADGAGDLGEEVVADGVAVQAVMEAAYRSDATGRAVTIAELLADG
jgi:hypothetical protein